MGERWRISSELQEFRHAFKRARKLNSGCRETWRVIGMGLGEVRVTVTLGLGITLR